MMNAQQIEQVTRMAGDLIRQVELWHVEGNDLECIAIAFNSVAMSLAVSVQDDEHLPLPGIGYESD